MAAQLQRQHPTAQSRPLAGAPAAPPSSASRAWAALAAVVRTTLQWLRPEPISSPDAATPYLGAPPRHWPDWPGI